MDDQVSGARRNLSRPILRQYLAKCFALMRSHELSLIEHRTTAGRERSPFELISRLLLFKEYAFRVAHKELIHFFLRANLIHFVRECSPILPVHFTCLLRNTRKVISPTCIRGRWFRIPLSVPIRGKTCLGGLRFIFNHYAKSLVVGHAFVVLINLRPRSKLGGVLIISSQGDLAC